LAKAGKPALVGRPAAALLAALVAVLALVAAGCGGGSDSGGSSDFGALSDSDREGQVLQLYGFGEGDDVAQNRVSVAKQAIAPATVKNPEGAFNPQRFLTQLASGTVPDLVYLDRQQVATLAAKGALQPLDSCVDAQKIDLSQYRQAALDEASYQDKLYALPEFTNQRTLIVNTTAVQEAGLKLSDVQTTDWDKLKVVAKKLTKTEGGKVTRIGFDPKIPEFFLMWAKANGADLLSADGKTAKLNDPKAVEALEYTKSLIDEQGGWQGFKAFRDTWDFFGEQNPVAADQIGAWPMESWYWNVLSDTSPDAPVAAVPFTDRNGKEMTFFTGTGWAIPKGAKNPGLACTWIKSMTSVEAWMNAAKKRAAAAKAAGQAFTGLYTANARADERILDEVYKPSSPSYDAAVKLLVDVQKNAVYWPASPAGAQIQQAVTDAINRALAGSQTPKASLARAQVEAQKAIDAAAG
jgi:multiple sugar transport system substrate-binding protein